MNAASSPRIVLHVGAPKTASTYIQRRLRINAEVLRKNNIHVPVLPAVTQMAGNAKLLPVALGQRPSLTFQRAFPNIDIRALNPKQIVSDLLRDWRPDDESLILSAENLRPAHAQAMRELLPTNVPSVVIFFVRRQDRWLDSYFNQMIKTHEIHEDISAFLSRLLTGEDERLCHPNWVVHYQAWRDAFGGCEVVFYDEVASDVFGAFLAAAGLPTLKDLIDIDRVQVSLNIYEIGYLLALKAPDYPEFLWRKSASEKASRQLGLSETRSILTGEDLSQLRNACEHSNRQLLQALGRSENNSLLQLDANCNSNSYCSLSELHSSDSYARFRKTADAIYARRHRREYLKSFFKRA